MDDRTSKLIEKSLSRLKESGIQPIRATVKPISWGNFEQCKELFIAVFKTTDETVKEYRHITEYDKVITWMTDTRGLGLYLVGHIGRGKSNIIERVLPVLFAMRTTELGAANILRGFHANEMKINLDRLLKRKMWYVDEIGREPTASDYGEKYESFNVLIDDAERNLKQIFISTNLQKDEMTKRYDQRTINRLERLCLKVEFKGESFRR